MASGLVQQGRVVEQVYDRLTELGRRNAINDSVVPGEAQCEFLYGDDGSVDDRDLVPESSYSEDSSIGRIDDRSEPIDSERSQCTHTERAALELIGAD